MLTQTEVELMAVACSDPITVYLDTRQHGLILGRVEKSHGIELSEIDRKAVLARADEHRAAHGESREVVPMTAVVVAFPVRGGDERARQLRCPLFP